MRREDFIYDLMAEYKAPDVNKNFKFSDGLNKFCDIIGDIEYQDIYEHIRQSQGKYKTIPYMKKFYDYARSKGLMKSAGNKQSKIWAKCDNPECGTQYSYNSMACPICGNKHRLMMSHSDGSPPPDSIIKLQERCFMCKVYAGSLTNDKSTAFGPDCEHWGSDWRGYPYPYCKSCKCLECCKLDRRFKNNQAFFNDDIKSGRVKEPWLGV